MPIGPETTVAGFTGEEDFDEEIRIEREWRDVFALLERERGLA
jgi:hypothetical protein